MIINEAVLIIYLLCIQNVTSFFNVAIYGDSKYMNICTINTLLLELIVSITMPLNENLICYR